MLDTFASAWLARRCCTRLVVQVTGVFVAQPSTMVWFRCKAISMQCMHVARIRYLRAFVYNLCEQTQVGIVAYRFVIEGYTILLLLPLVPHPPNHHLISGCKLDQTEPIRLWSGEQPVSSGDASAQTLSSTTRLATCIFVTQYSTHLTRFANPQAYNEASLR